jgi:hypothetical protein
MNIETIDLPGQPEVAAADDQQTAAPVEETKAEGEQTEQTEEPKKPEKTPEQRELDRARRKIDRLVRQREELRAVLQQRPVSDTNHTEQDDGESLTLSKAELQRVIKAEAEKLAPTMQAQKAEIEHRQKVVQTLAKSWGQEKFDQIASDLDDAFGGLADQRGAPKPATDAIFEADDPKALVEYLSDPEHAEEAANIARMNAISAGRAIGKIEAKLAAMKAESKPQRSSAAAPLSAVRGAGTVNTAAPTDVKAYMAWANKQYGSI